MARFNSTQSTISVTTTTTLAGVADKATILLTGSSGYTLTLASPVLYPGTTQNIYNATGGNVTIASAAGNLIGNGFTSASSQTIPNNTTYSVTSNGTDYVITNNQGGPISVTTGTFSSTATFNSTVSMSPASANVTISPSGTGTVTISPVGTLTMQPSGNTVLSPSGTATLTLGTAGLTTTMNGNISATATNQTVSFSPAGASSSVTVNPASGIISLGNSTSSTVAVKGNLIVAGRQTNITAATASGNYTYDGNGRITQFVDGNKTTSSITYDANGRISGFTETITDANSAVVYSQARTVTYTTYGDPIIT